MKTRPPLLPILVAASILLLAAVVAWYPQRAVTILVRVERAVYVSGEPVNFTMVLRIEGNRPITVTSPLGIARCGSLHYAVEDENHKMIYEEAEGVVYCPLMTSRLLQPGDIVSLNFSWNQVNRSGSPVPPGQRYTLIPLLTVLEDVRVFATPVRIFVQPT